MVFIQLQIFPTNYGFVDWLYKCTSMELQSFTANNCFPLKVQKFSPLNVMLYTVLMALIREYFLIFVGLEARSSDVDVYHQIS